MITSPFVLSGIVDEGADRIEDQIELHQALGWNHVELRNVNGVPIDDLAETDWSHVMDQLSAAGISVSCLASNIGKLKLGAPASDFEAEQQTLEKLLRKAQRLQCRFIRVMAYKQGDKSETEWRDEAAAQLRKLAAIAKSYDIKLALENCIGWHAHSGQRMADLLDRIGSAALVALYDTANPLCLYDQDAWSYYQAIRDRIEYIHIKDSIGLHKYTYPGEGFTCIPEVLKDQWLRGYRGFLSIEPHMSKSAHLKHLPGDEASSSRIYLEYGQRLNDLLKNRFGEYAL